MSHTEGKLRVSTYGTEILDSRPVGIASVDGRSFDEQKANARRLVACWNAMDGVDDPELWVAQMRHMDGDHTISRDIIQELQKERDVLLKSLDILERLSGLAMMEDDPVRVAARTILARYQK